MDRKTDTKMDSYSVNQKVVTMAETMESKLELETVEMTVVE